MTSSWFSVQNYVNDFAILVTHAQPNWTLKPVNTAARVNTTVGLYCEGDFGGNQWTRSILNDLGETLQQQIYIVSRNTVSLPDKCTWFSYPEFNKLCLDKLSTMHWISWIVFCLKLAKCWPTHLLISISKGSFDDKVAWIHIKALVPIMVHVSFAIYYVNCILLTMCI